MLPFDHNRARLSIKVSSKSIIRRKRSDDERNPTGSHEIVISLFLIVLFFFLFFLISWTDKFLVMFLLALTTRAIKKMIKELQELTKKKCEILPYSSEVSRLTRIRRGETFSLENLPLQLSFLCPFQFIKQSWTFLFQV